VAIAALKGDKTLAELAEQFALHPNRSIQFRQYALEHMAELFDKDKAPKAAGV
jgi:transposase